MFFHFFCLFFNFLSFLFLAKNKKRRFEISTVVLVVRIFAAVMREGTRCRAGVHWELLWTHLVH